MPAFITETTDEKPRVLLITQQGSFSTAFKTEIHKKNMDLVVLEESAFTEPGQAHKLAAAKATFFYKIFWWWGELSEAPPAASAIIEFLLSRREQIAVGASILPPFEITQPGLEHWQRIFDLQTRNLAYLQQYLSTAQVLLTGSLVGEREDYLTRLIYAQISSSQPIFPDTIFSAATRAEVSSKITRFLLQPHKDNRGIYLQGTQFLASHVLEVFQLNNPQEIQLLPVKIYTQFFNNLSQVPIETPEGKKELLHEVKNWRVQPKIITHKPATESDPEEVMSVAVKHVVIPRVEPAVIEQTAVAPTPKESKFSKLVRKETKTKVFIPIAPPTPPAWYPELDGQLEEMIRRRKPKVVSTFPPIIENRLKRYEVTKKQKVDQQKHLAHLPKNTVNPRHGEDTDILLSREKTPEEVKKVKELDSQIVKIFGEQRQVVKKTSTNQTVQQVKRVVKKNKRQSKFIVVLGVFMSALIFAGFLAGAFFLNKFLVESALQAVITQNSVSASEKNNRAIRLTAYANAFSFQTDVWKKILGEDNLKYSATLADVGKEAANSVALDSEMTQLSRDLLQQILGLAKQNPMDTIVALNGKTEDSYKKLSLIQAKIENLEQDGNVETNKQLVAFNDQIQDKRKLLAISQQFEQTLPFLIAHEGRRTYLIVLQNNLELRPTGGVVEAAVLATFQNGVLTNTQSLNVAQLDQNFTGQVLPPADLQSVLGQKKWLLRDANWSANFPSAAQQMSSFVEKSTNQQVDGVIGLNLYSLQELIRATGPINLPQYQETVTDKNLMEKVEFHSELAVVPTSAPDYLTVLLNEELNRITELPAEKTQAFTEALYTSLKGNQLLFFSTDSGVASTLESVGWSGEVLTPNCPTQFADEKGECMVDSIFQVESNVGINRANFYIQRSIDHKIAVSNTEVSHVRTILYNNTATSNAWPAGNYKNYLRFYLPTTAQSVTATINGQQVAASDMMQYIDGNKKVVGFLVTVPIQQHVPVVFSYTEPIKQTTPFAYTFFDQKQSGTAPTPLQITVTPNTTLKPIYIAPQATILGGQIRFTALQDKHLFVGIKLR